MHQNDEPASSTPNTDTFYRIIAEYVQDGVYFVDTARKILFWNAAAESLTGRTAATIVGSYCYDNILDHVDDAGRHLCHDGCPLQATIEDGVPRQARVYLWHAKGHRVPVLVKTSAAHDSEGKIIGGVEIFSDDSQYEVHRQRLQTLEELSYADHLTGLPNRRLGLVTLKSRMDEFVRYGWQFGVLMLDIDDFKSVNDTYGHNFGDTVLRMLANTLEGAMRSSDVACRWGGEEFLIIAGNTGAEEIRNLAERCRALVGRSKVEDGGELLSVTVSAGATVFREGDDADTVVARADGLMYEGKKAGKNRVVCG